MQDATSGSGAGRLKAKGKSKANKGSVVGKKRDKTRKERFQEVESFWCTSTPAQRRELLRVPLRALLEGGRREGAQEPLSDLVEGLVLLREQSNRSVRYWSCPACDTRFHSAKEYLSHVEMFHEELAVQVGARVWFRARLSFYNSSQCRWVQLILSHDYFRSRCTEA